MIRDSKELIRLVQKHGWVHSRTTGSHWHFKHPIKKNIVTIPHPKRDLPIGTVKSIYRQAQLKEK